MSKKHHLESAAKQLSLRGMAPSLLSLFLAFSLMAPCLAGAITVESTTARPTQTTSGNAVYSGDLTRVTWEGVLDSDEDLLSVSISFPEGTVFGEEAYAKLTVLEGLDRIDTSYTASVIEGGFMILVDKPLAAGSRLRVEMYEVGLPAIDGGVILGGSYSNSKGQAIALPDSNPIIVTAKSNADAIVSWLDQQAWVEKWNSSKFLRTFLKPQLIVASFPSLFQGWLRALALVILGFPLAIPFGLALALLKMNKKFGVLRGIASFYINVVRGTPLFLQIYVAFFGLPLMGFTVNNYVVGVVVLAMNSSAYLAEIFRAGIQSIHKGQFEAAASLGMNSFQTMFNVIIPQTVRRVIPTMTSEFILLYKDTSLLSAVGVMELMMFGKSLVANSGNITPYVVAACYYLIVTLPLIKVVDILEARLAGSDGGVQAKKEKKGKSRKSLKLFGQNKTPGESLAAEPVPALESIAADAPASGIEG